MVRPSIEREWDGPYWIVLTPSVDDRAWRKEIARAAHEAGLSLVDLTSDRRSDIDQELGVVFITDDANLTLANAQGGQIAALLPEPGTAYEALEDRLDIIAPQSVWHASQLLAAAIALAPEHRVITQSELARKPTSLRLFDRLSLKPPASAVEIPRKPAVHASFDIYASMETLPGSPVSWGNRLFIYDQKDPGADWGVLDTTGRPRLLVYGPYLSLPPGRWRAQIRFGVDSYAAKHQFRVDWGTRTACISEYVTPGAPGIYEIGLDFDWDRTDAAEIRLILTEGSFMGTVLFQGLTVERLPASLVSVEEAAA